MEAIGLNQINSFLKGYISTESSALKSSSSLCDLFTDLDCARACDAQTQISSSLRCLLTDAPSSIPSAQSSGSNRTLVSTVKNLPDVSRLLSTINRPFRTLANVVSVECLFLNSGWKSWKIKGQMVCEAANNQFSNSFEMKGQLENGLKLPAHNCDCVWVVDLV